MPTMTIKIQGPQLLEGCSVLFEDFREQVTLGRSSRCDVRLPLPTISGHHLTFRRQGSRWEVCDAGSTNGTTLDGESLARGAFAPLEHGAMLRILETSIQVDMRASEGFTIGDADGMTQEMIRGILQKQGDDDVAFLEVIRGESYRGQKFSLHDELKEVFVGAQTGALIQLRAAGAPARALTITRHGDGFAINPQPEAPLILNGAPISRSAPLAHGDRIASGDIELIFRDPLEGYWDELDGLSVGDTAHGNHDALERPPAPAPPVLDASGSVAEPEAPAAPQEPLAPVEASQEQSSPPPSPQAIPPETQEKASKKGVGALEVVVGGMIVLVLLACVGLIMLTVSGGG